MAQLKDTIVSGNLRVTDTTMTDTLQVTTIKAPTSSGGTTYGPGTSGQVLKSNGTTAYWGSDTNSDVNVTQTATTTDASYEVLFSGTADNTTRTETARKNSNLKFNPSTGSLYANYMYAGGAESQSAYPAGGYHVYDCRSVSVTPANGDKTANFYFHMTGTPDTSKWWSIMHVRGWAGDHSTWEIAGPAHNVDQRTTPLYVRTSNKNSAWGSWRKIYDTSNPPTASEVGALSTSTKYALSTSVGGNAILSDGLATKTLTSETIDTTAGSFVFGGTDLIGNASYDWAGIQVDAANDSFQLTVNGQLIFRQNDSTSKTSDNWGEWKGCLTSSNVIGSGGITVAQNDITIGSGTGSYTYKGAVTISHSNSITASTSTVFKKFSYDAHGHITDIENVAKSDITALGIPAQDTKYGISGAYGANSNTWVTTITAGGTGNTSTVPTASTSAYGITKLYNGVDSTSTGLAATANAVKTAYDKANHSHPYLPLAGGTMTGVLTLKGEQYSGNYAMDCNNSDVIGVNSIRFADPSGNYNEGISFPRTTADHWDTIWANGGEFYFTPNHETDAAGATSYKVLHTNNTSFSRSLTSGTKIGSITIAGSSTDIYAPTNTDTEVNVTLGTTTKAYLLATSTTPTATAQAVTSIADTGVYLTTTSGELCATKFTTSGHNGYYTYDVGNNKYPLIFDNNTNLWIGAEQSVAYHHKGQTYISAGWSGTLPTTAGGTLTGHSTIFISIPTYTATSATEGTWSHAPKFVLHSGNFTTTGSGNAITSVEFTNEQLTFTKGSTFALSTHTHSQYYDSTLSRTANTVLAAPNGSNGTATFRKLVAADIPALNYSKVSISRNLTSGTKVGTITIDGTATDLYCQTNTDVNVTQTATTTNADYEVLFSATADNTTRTETARKNSNLKFNPSTGSLYASKYYGEFDCLNEVANNISYAMVLAIHPDTHEPNTLRKNPNAVISFKNGTASEEGWAQITLGNETPSGTDGNSTGWLKLFSPSSGSHYITGASTTSTIIHTLPTVGGTVLNSGNYLQYMRSIQKLYAATTTKGWRRILTIPASNSSGYTIGRYEFHFTRQWNNGAPESFGVRVICNYTTPIIHLLYAEQNTRILTDFRVTRSSDSTKIHFEVWYDATTKNDFSVRYVIQDPWPIPHDYSTFPTETDGSSAGSSFLPVVSDSPTSQAMIAIPAGGISQFNLRQVTGSYGGYFGMADAAGSDSAWIRTTSQGLLPYQSGDGTSGGHCSLGTSGWYFGDAYINRVYGNTADFECFQPRHSNEFSMKEMASYTYVWFNYRLITDDKQGYTTEPTKPINQYWFGCGKARNALAKVVTSGMIIYPGAANTTSYSTTLQSSSLTANRTATLPNATGTIPLVTEKYNSPTSTATSYNLTNAASFKLLMITAKPSSSLFGETTVIVPAPTTAGTTKTYVNWPGHIAEASSQPTRSLGGYIRIQYLNSGTCTVDCVLADYYLQADSSVSSKSTSGFKVYITRIIGISY